MRSLGTERRSTKGCPIAELRVTLFRFNSFKDSWPNSLLCIGKGLIQRIGKLKSMQREDINPEAYVPPDRTSDFGYHNRTRGLANLQLSGDLARVANCRSS